MKAALLALAAVVARPPQPAPCLTGSEAESLATVALPEVIRSAGRACQATLPVTSLLRRPASTLIQRYDAEADRVWPAARAAIVKLSDPAAEALLGSDYARPLLSSLIAPMIVGRIQTSDCGMIDRLVTLLEPLPPRNTAGVIVTALRYARQAKPAVGQRNPLATLPLCTAEAR